MLTINSNRVRDLLFQRGLSIREFATQAGLNELTARKTTRDGATVSMKVVGALAKFFGVDGNELIITD